MKDIMKRLLMNMYAKLLNKIHAHQNQEYLINGYRQDINSFCEKLGQEYVSITNVINGINPAMASYDKNNDGSNMETFYLVASIRYLQNSTGGLKNVLEIGTGCGDNTNMLSTVANYAEIYTFDLPENDPYYISKPEVDTVWRTDRKDKFIQNTQFPNVNLHLSNSLFLLDEDLPKYFDLIWMDGAHSYPAVAWDFAYAYNRLRRGGILLIDDWVDKEKLRNPITKSYPAYGLTDVKHLLEYVSPRIKEDIVLLPRAPLAKKYVAMIIK